MPFAFDIETGPLPFESVQHLLPTTENLKLGNTKDKDKIDSKLALAQAAFMEKAALKPETGQVLAIGIKLSDDSYDMTWQHDSCSEADMISLFWKQLMTAITSGQSAIGWNIMGFDLPFLMRRSWHLNVSVPQNLMTRSAYFHANITDLMKLWCCGKYGEFAKLSDAAEFLGHKGKFAGFTGKNFADLFNEDRESAMLYLRHDLDTVWAVAERIL